jgi:hypothetical protein
MLSWSDLLPDNFSLHLPEAGKGVRVERVRPRHHLVHLRQREYILLKEIETKTKAGGQEKNRKLSY